MQKTALILMAALFLAAVPARGGEEDEYAQILRRYDLVNAELQRTIRELDYPEPVAEYPQRLLSINRNASVRIGGELRVDYIGTRGNYVDPSPPPAGTPATPGAPGKANLNDLKLSTTRLTVDARVGNRWRGFFEMNLGGNEDINPVWEVRNPNTAATVPPAVNYLRRNRPETLRQAYLELLKASHSGLGAKLGLMQLPFGLEGRPNLVGRSFLDAPDLTNSYLMAPLSWNNGVRLPHASRFRNSALAAMLSYELRDIIRFEGGVFQDMDYPSREYWDDGVLRYRSDSGVGRSWQVGASFLPLEGWELSATFRNRHSRTRGIRYWADSPYRWDFRNNLAGGGGDPRWDPVLSQWSDTGAGPAFGSRSSEQALAIGLAVEIPNTKLAVQLEYAHGWNQGFNKYLNSDDVNLGLSYRATPFLTVFAQGEWLHLKDRSWMADLGGGAWARDTRNNRLYRLLLGAEYELMRGLTVEAGWQYEYWNITSAMGGGGGARDERVTRANMYYLGTRFVF